NKIPVIETQNSLSLGATVEPSKIRPNNLKHPSSGIITVSSSSSNKCCEHRCHVSLTAHYFGSAKIGWGVFEMHNRSSPHPNYKRAKFLSHMGDVAEFEVSDQNAVKLAIIPKMARAIGLQGLVN